MSPAINIRIGDLGNQCIHAIQDIFFQRERDSLSYISFHHLQLKVNGLAVSTLEKGDLIREHTEASEFIQYAYNHMVTLLKQLNEEPDYFNIQFNFFFAAYDDTHSELILQLLRIVSSLTTRGTFGAVRIQCFYFLANGSGIERNGENLVTRKSLDNFCANTKNMNVSAQLFIIDDRNTAAVYLGDGHAHLWFAISEIVLALMTQHYTILANLKTETNVFSVGLGMIYFDELYFKAFFRRALLNSLLVNEQLFGKEPIFASSERWLEFSHVTIAKICEGRMSAVKIDQKIQETFLDEESTIGNYRFLLNSIIFGSSGESESKVRAHSYKFEDTIYALIYHEVLSNEEIKEKRLLSFVEYWQKQEERSDASAKLKQLKKELVLTKEQLSNTENAICQVNLAPATINPIEWRSTQLTIEKQQLEARVLSLTEQIDSTSNNLTNIEEAVAEHLKSKEEILSTFGDKYIRWDHLDSMAKEEAAILKRKEQLQNELQNKIASFTSRSIVGRWLSVRKFKNEKDKLFAELENQLIEETRIKNCADKIDEVERLFNFLRELEDAYKTVSDAVETLMILQRKYTTAFRSIGYLQTVFLQNILSDTLMESYEERHRRTLQDGLKDALTILRANPQGFKRAVKSQIDRNVDEIIDFKMDEYLTGGYEGRRLFLPHDFGNRLESLKKSQLPFFNAIPGYAGPVHQMQYFKAPSNPRTRGVLKKTVDQNYTGAPPYLVEAESSHKFGLISVGIISDLAQVVKYNDK